MGIDGVELGVLQSQGLRSGDKSKKITITTTIIIMVMMILITTTNQNKKTNHQEMGEIPEITSFPGRKKKITKCQIRGSILKVINKQTNKQTKKLLNKEQQLFPIS